MRRDTNCRQPGSGDWDVMMRRCKTGVGQGQAERLRQEPKASTDRYRSDLPRGKGVQGRGM